MNNHKKTKRSEPKGFQFPENLIEFDPVSGKYIANPFPRKPDTQKEDIKDANMLSKAVSPLKPLDFNSLFSDDTKISSKSNGPQNKRSMKPLDFKDLHSEDIKDANMLSKAVSPLKPLDFNSLFSDDTKISSKSNGPQNKRSMKPLDFKDLHSEDIKDANMLSKAVSPLKPLDFNNLFSDETKTSSKSNRPQNKRSIKPLDLKDLHSDTEEVETKIRKVSTAPHSARRLFPLKKQQHSIPSFSRDITSRTSLLSKKRNENATSAKSSPLLKMEEVEQKLLKRTTSLKAYQFRSPDLPKFRFSKLANFHGQSEILEIPEIIVEECETFLKQMDDEVMEEEHEPKTPDSTQEFHKLEQLCKDSPITSVCNLMQDTRINSIKKTKSFLVTHLELTKQIEKFKQEEEIRHMKFIQDEEIRYQQTINMFNTVLEKLTNNEENGKENKINRRSERLLKKSPSMKSKLLTSPVVANTDLRKSTLKKNLAAKSLDFQICSPRVQKAMSLYNSLSFFQTPKSDRKNLSARLQDQCFLLQDTPVHK